MNKRDYFKKRYLRDPLNKYFETQYKSLRNQVTKSVREAKGRRLHHSLLRCTNDSRKSWKIINQQVLNRPPRSKEDIALIKDEQGASLTDLLEINNFVADYFTNIYEQIKPHLCPTTTDPLAHVKKITLLCD